MTFSPVSIPGTASISTPIPEATPTMSIPIASAVPSTYGSVRRNPNRIPDAHRIALFGPGDTVPTKANGTSATSSFTGRCNTTHSSPVLYVRAVAEAPREWVRAWRPAVPGVREVFHARFVDHVYPPHTHEAWTVFLVDEGAVRYDLETKHRGVAGRRVTLLPPHVVHDGRAANAVGYRKRVLYLDAEVLPERLIGASVDRPDTEDPSIVDSVARVHRAVEERSDPLEIESALAIAAERLLTTSERAERRAPCVPRTRSPVSSASSSTSAGSTGSRSPTQVGRCTPAPGHLVRSFTRAFGIAPHRYVIGRRIDAARALLLEGEPIADVAVAVGFHDQAHLTRHFRRHVGTTPGRFVASPVETLEGGPPPEGQFRSSPH
jgi:hypothetical protein